MLNVRRLSYPADASRYTEAFKWQRDQPDIYGDNVGFDDFEEFVNAGDLALDIAVEDDDRLLAFCTLFLQSKGVCRAALIAPQRSRVRSIVRGVLAIQKAYFEDLHYWYLFVTLPDGEEFDRARRIARLLGWREVNPNHFEISIIDHLEAQA